MFSYLTKNFIDLRVKFYNFFFQSYSLIKLVKSVTCLISFSKYFYNF